MSNAWCLLSLFVEIFGSRREHVTLRMRGGANGHVHIIPPGVDPTKRKNRHLLVELKTGTVGVTKLLKDVFHAHGRENVPISDLHPLGYSIAPKFGRFKWGLTFKDIEAWPGGIRQFVLDACGQLVQLCNAPDDTTEDEDGDFE